MTIKTEKQKKKKIVTKMTCRGTAIKFFTCDPVYSNNYLLKTCLKKKLPKKKWCNNIENTKIVITLSIVIVDILF